MGEREVGEERISTGNLAVADPEAVDLDRRPACAVVGGDLRRALALGFGDRLPVVDEKSSGGAVKDGWVGE